MKSLIRKLIPSKHSSKSSTKRTGSESSTAVEKITQFEDSVKSRRKVSFCATVIDLGSRVGSVEVFPSDPEVSITAHPGDCPDGKHVTHSGGSENTQTSCLSVPCSNHDYNLINNSSVNISSHVLRCRGSSGKFSINNNDLNDLLSEKFCSIFPASANDAEDSEEDDDLDDDDENAKINVDFNNVLGEKFRSIFVTSANDVEDSEEDDDLDDDDENAKINDDFNNVLGEECRSIFATSANEMKHSEDDDDDEDHEYDCDENAYIHDENVFNCAVSSACGSVEEVFESEEDSDYEATAQGNDFDWKGMDAVDTAGADFGGCYSEDEDDDDYDAEIYEDADIGDGEMDSVADDGFVDDMILCGPNLLVDSSYATEEDNPYCPPAGDGGCFYAEDEEFEIGGVQTFDSADNDSYLHDEEGGVGYEDFDRDEIDSDNSEEEATDTFAVCPQIDTSERSTAKNVQVTFEELFSQMPPQVAKAVTSLLAASGQDMNGGLDIHMIEALLAQVQSSGAVSQLYDDIHDDDDDEDDYDDEEDDDEDSYFPGENEQHNINMYQNPYVHGGTGGAGDDDHAANLSVLQGIINMSAGAAAAAGLNDMSGSVASMVGGIMGAGAMDGAGQAFDPSMLHGLLGAIGASASGMVEGFGGAGVAGTGAVLRDYDEDEEEEITEGSESDEDDEESDDEDDEDHVHLNMAATMGGMAMGAGAATMAAVMMGQQQHLQHSAAPSMMPPFDGRPLMPPQSPFVLPGVSAGTSLFSPSPSINSSVNIPPQATTAMQTAGQTSPFVKAGGIAVAAAAAASTLFKGRSSPVPVQPAIPASLANTSCAASVATPMPPILSPPVATISTGLGGGTMSRVDPLAALAVGGVMVGGQTMSKVVSTLSNNLGGGTTIVKPDMPTYTSAPVQHPTTIHKSLDELNKLSDTMCTPRIANFQMQPLHQLQSAMSHQHLPHMSTSAQPGINPGIVFPNKFIPAGMMMRAPVLPAHLPTGVLSAGRNNDGDKTSLDRESVPCSETSGGGKSDTESTTKKTPSPTMVGPGRVSPDSSSGESSGSDAHVKNATSLASLSDLHSATESMRDSDTDHHSDRLMSQRLMYLEHDTRFAGTNSLYSKQSLIIESPTFGWSSLVGHETAKEALKSLFLGKKFPEVFDSQGSCRGVLLFGPSGAGKTSLARALACEVGGAKLIAFTPTLISNRSIHPVTAAMLIRQMFDHARVNKPCVMLLDEIERLATPQMSDAERAAKAELMAQVRGETTLQPVYPPSANINDNVMLVATTCAPWQLPEDLRRLFAYNVHIKLPGEKQREELFRMFLNNYAHNITADHLKCVITKSEGYAAADIHTVIRQAATYNPPPMTGAPVHLNHPRVVTYDDLASAMTNYRCSCKPDELAMYKKYIDEATHRTGEREEDKKKPKGVKKFGRLAKSFAAAVISVID